MYISLLQRHITDRYYSGHLQFQHRGGGRFCLNCKFKVNLITKTLFKTSTQTNKQTNRYWKSS